MPSFATFLGEDYFNQQYKRGSILRFIMECDDPERGTRYKFGVVLNNPGEDEALLAITTSNLEAFASGRFENDILRIDANAYPCFDKPTILSLRAIHPESVAHLKDLCKSGQLIFHGEVTSDDWALIEQKVIHSRIIEGKYRKRILSKS